MPLHRRQSILVALAAGVSVLTACSDVDRPVSVRPPVRPETVKTETARPAWQLDLTDALAARDAARKLYEAAWVIAVAKGVESERAAAASGRTVQGGQSDYLPLSECRSGRPCGFAAAAPSLQPCGPPDLPPCYVKARESGGSYTAYNPTGCASFCYGAWQFSSEWGGKLGLPEDIRNATPAQQDAAARELYNGGAGCSNWDSC